MVLVSQSSLHASMPSWCGMLVYNEVTYIVTNKVSSVRSEDGVFLVSLRKIGISSTYILLSSPTLSFYLLLFFLCKEKLFDKDKIKLFIFSLFFLANPDSALQGR